MRQRSFGAPIVWAGLATLTITVAGAQGANGAHLADADAAGKGTTSAYGVVDVPIYQIDALVRRAPSLQKTKPGREPASIYGPESQGVA